MANNVSFGVQAKGVGKASSDLDKIRDKFDKLQKKSGKSLLAGFAGGAAVAGIGLATQAVGQLTDAVGDAIQAARDEEVSIQKLGTSLKANIPAWDGNTDAIERTLKARMKLGFSDDEQRESLSRIVVATKNVNKALEVQRTAMDLARLKGISLAEAGDALIKVEGGQFRALKALGIQLKAGATATDALRAVQAAAANQAEDYAKTNEGKLLVSQVKVGEAMEKFGGAILPAVTEAMVGAADGAVALSDTLDLLQGNVAKTTEGQKEQIDSAADLFGSLGALIPIYGVLSDATKQAAEDATRAAAGFDAAGDNSVNMAERTKGAAGGMGDSFETMEEGAEDWRDTYRDVAGDVIRRNNRIQHSFAETTQAIIDDYYDPIETRGDAHDAHMETLAALERIRNGKNAESRNEAAQDVITSIGEEATALTKLGDKGKLTAKDVETFIANTTAAYKAMGIKVPAEVQKIIDRLRTLAKMPDINKTVTIRQRQINTGTGSGTHGGGKGPQEFDRGGVVQGPAGSPQEAIVHAGETVRTPAQERALRSPSASMGGGPTFNVTVNAGIGSGLTAADGRKLADTIGPALYADMARRGLIPRTATGLRG